MKATSEPQNTSFVGLALLYGPQTKQGWWGKERGRDADG